MRADLADFNDVGSQCLQPGEEPVQRSLIGKRPVHDRFDWLGNRQVVEIDKCLGRENPRHPDLIVESLHTEASSQGDAPRQNPRLPVTRPTLGGQAGQQPPPEG
jgi:hypothetical protein